MSNKNSIIVINDKEYDSVTGFPLNLINDTPKQPVKTASKQSLTKTSKTSPKSSKTAPKKPRQPAKNVAPHKPKPASTLMRGAVKKPPKSLKRTIKAQSHVDGLPKQPAATLSIKKSAKKVDSKLLSYAKRIHRSPLIQHFSSIAADDISHRASTKQSSTKMPANPPKLSSTPVGYSKNRKPQTTEELLEYALSKATSHEEKPPRIKKSRNPLKRKS